MSVLALMDKGPGLMSYWEPDDDNDFQIIPHDLMSHVDAYLESVRALMILVCGEAKTYNSAELVMYDYKSKKLRCYTVALREERL